MKIIESFYGSESLLKICPDSCRPQIVARIRVEVAGKILAAESRHDNWAGSPPYSHVMRNLQQQILREVGKELFGS